MQKKWVIGITAITLTAVTAIGSTLAYFTMHTDPMTNNFTVAAQGGLTGQIREPGWDGYDFGSATTPTGTTANSDVTGDNAKALGLNQAKTMMPGDVINKNPNLMNTTNWDFSSGALKASTSSVPVYMAIKVTYDEATAAAVTAGTLAPNFSTKWTKIGGGTNSDSSEYSVYLWTGVANGTTAASVESGASPTDALFTTVTVSENATSLDNFSIAVKGAEIQAKNLTDETTIENDLTAELNK